MPKQIGASNAEWNGKLFVASFLCTSATAALAIGGSVLYTVLYLGAFVALVPDNKEDSVQYWDDHAEKNMFTVFVCAEMFVSRCWALYECFRVLRTEILGSAIEQRRWALSTMWIAVCLTLLLDAATHFFIYTKDSTCQDVQASDIRKQLSFEALCAQSSHNQTLVHALHYTNAGLLLLSAILLTLDTIQQSKEMEQNQRSELDDFLDATKLKSEEPLKHE